MTTEYPLLNIYSRIPTTYETLGTLIAAFPQAAKVSIELPQRDIRVVEGRLQKFYEFENSKPEQIKMFLEKRPVIRDIFKTISWQYTNPTYQIVLNFRLGPELEDCYEKDPFLRQIDKAMKSWRQVAAVISASADKNQLEAEKTLIETIIAQHAKTGYVIIVQDTSSHPTLKQREELLSELEKRLKRS